MEETCRTFLFIWCADSMRSLGTRITRDRFTSDRIVFKRRVTLLVIKEPGFVLSAGILEFLTTWHPRIRVTGKFSHTFCNYGTSEFLVTNFSSRRPTWGRRRR